jgi:hypothetical protein
LVGVGKQVAPAFVQVLGQFGVARELLRVDVPLRDGGEIALPRGADPLQDPLSHVGG